MKYIYSFLFLLCFSGVAQAEQWICVATGATGFIYKNDSKRWESTDFSIADIKLLIHDLDPDSTISKSMLATRGVTKIGKDSPTFFCSSEAKSAEGLTGEFNERGVIFCKSFTGNLVFNRKNLRFISYSTGDYVDIDPESENPFIPRADELSDLQPLIIIGKCSKL